MDWLDICFGLFNTCGGVWLNWVGKIIEANEEHDENCVEEGFQLTRVKFERDGEGGRKAVGMGNCCIIIWDGSELELDWSKKGTLYFENNFSTFLLSGILNSSVFKVCDVLHWVNFWVMKTSNIFQSTSY